MEINIAAHFLNFNFSQTKYCVLFFLYFNLVADVLIACILVIEQQDLNSARLKDWESRLGNKIPPQNYTRSRVLILLEYIPLPRAPPKDFLLDIYKILPETHTLGC